ncbi:MAG: hypothetical protein QM692_10820 [Thermomicrobiales bacterium]
MAIIGERIAAWRQPSGLARWLGAAALIGVWLAGASGSGGASARLWQQDAGRSVGWHQADLPNQGTPGSDDMLNACLQREWVFVQEESSDAVQVYRPADYPLGPARGRFGYEFLAGGQLIYRGIGPADGPLTSPGQWAWVTPDAIHIAVSDPQGAYIDETLRVVSCDAEMLQVERVTGPESETPAAP